MAERFDRIWHNARLATMRGRPARSRRDRAWRDRRAGGHIVYAGAETDLPADADATSGSTARAAGSRPGLVDCHTHLVYGGNRAHEFELRLEGATYEEIARAGGGIVSTMRATRSGERGRARSQAPCRALDALIARGRHHGRDQVRLRPRPRDRDEVSSRVARRLGRRAAGLGRHDFLGAHALPPEAKGDKDAYIADVCKEMLPAVAKAGLADAVDAFCEGIAFSPEQTTRVFEAARALGLPVKLHAEQLSNLGGAALAARFGALSADHLEHTDEAGIAAMAKAGTVAVLLPGAFYFLRETQKPPVELLRKHGVPIAIATDCQSRHLAADLAAADHEHGRDPLPPDRRRMPAGVTRHAARGAGPAG